MKQLNGFKTSLEESLDHQNAMKGFLKNNDCETHREVKELFKKTPSPQGYCSDCVKGILKTKDIDHFCKRAKVKYDDASGDEVHMSPASVIMRMLDDLYGGVRQIKRDGYGNEDVWEEMKKKHIAKRTEKFNKRKKNTLEKEDFQEYKQGKVQRKRNKRKKTSSSHYEESDSETSHISITSDDDSDSSSDSELESV